MDNLIDNSKPALLWATLTIAGTITENINLIGGLISVGYTFPDFTDKTFFLW